MKVYRTIPGAWPGVKKIKIPYVSAIPPLDWKFWAMTGITFAWLCLLTFVLFRSANKPAVNQWWKNQSLLEQKGVKNNAPAKEPKTDPQVQFPKDGNYYKLNFDVLSSFPAEVPDMVNPRVDPRLKGKKPDSTVPGSITALNGQKISVSGFMIPMLMYGDKVSSFILAQSRMTCCYGVVPKLNQWIYVKMDNGKTTESTIDIPVTVFGTFSVGGEFDQQNKGWCLYRMTSDKIEIPRKSWF
jgi:hypothetical protein